MLGRGALGNTFIFKQIELLKDGKNYIPSIDEITKTAMEHICLLEKEQSLNISLDRAKKNIIWYFKYENGIMSLIDELYSATNFEVIKEIINNHSDRLSKDFYPPHSVEEIRKKFNNRVLFWLTKEEEKV